MLTAAKTPKSPTKSASDQLRKIAKRNEATPKGVLAGATKKLINAMQAKK